MALFSKKKKELSVPELKIQELRLTPKKHLFALQKRFDHLQDENINITTHLGELELNAQGEIHRIELFMERIKQDMDRISTRITNVSENMHFMISDLNLTARHSELEKFKHDLERIKPHNYITVSQFEKMVKDMIN